MLHNGLTSRSFFFLWGCVLKNKRAESPKPCILKEYHECPSVIWLNGFCSANEFLNVVNKQWHIFYLHVGFWYFSCFRWDLIVFVCQEDLKPMHLLLTGKTDYFQCWVLILLSSMTSCNYIYWFISPFLVLSKIFLILNLTGRQWDLVLWLLGVVALGV